MNLMKTIWFFQLFVCWTAFGFSLASFYLDASILNSMTAVTNFFLGCIGFTYINKLIENKA